MKYFEQFKAEMGQLFAKIEAKENESRWKIDQYEEKAKLKAFKGDMKNLL